MWLFHSSILILEDVSRQDYFNYYLLLVVTISVKLRIIFSMINIAQDFLNKFVREFGNLYGLQFYSIIRCTILLPPFSYRWL